jgi:hypothetical protein
VSLLALATLADMTQIGSFLFFVMPLKVTKASSYVAVAAMALALSCNTFAKVNKALKPCLHRQSLA